ncbi:phage minor tail protein [Streptococcus pneumoniae]|nr:phage minor tail protein [Streptococcus pneumoniae]
MQAMGHSTEDVTRSTKKLAAGIEGLPTTLNEVVGTAQRLTSITGDINKSTDLTENVTGNHALCFAKDC